MKQNSRKGLRSLLFQVVPKVQVVTCCNNSLNIPGHKIMSHNQKSNCTARAYDATNAFIKFLKYYQQCI